MTLNIWKFSIVGIVIFYHSLQSQTKLLPEIQAPVLTINWYVKCQLQYWLTDGKFVVQPVQSVSMYRLAILAKICF